MDKLKIGKKSIGGLLIGIVIGLVLFFNLPSLNSVLTQIAKLSLGLAAIGFVIENFSARIWFSVLLVTGLAVTGVFITSQICDLRGVFHPPAENTITGEVLTDGFNGFRLKTCDKGRYPWYFNEFNDPEAQRYCENNPDKRIRYCEITEMRENLQKRTR